MGAEFSELKADDKKKSNIESGVKVSKLYAGKLRSYTDIKEGFIITKVNHTPVKSVKELIKIYEPQEGSVMIEGVSLRDPTVYYYAFGI